MQQRINYFYVSVGLFIIAIATLFFLQEPVSLLQEYGRILTAPGLLLTDYLLVGGLYATLLNVLLTTFVNMLWVKLLRQNFSGSVIACLFIIAGFAFFGKNILNCLPLYMGILLFTRIHKLPFRGYILVFLLSSGVSPLVSFIVFGTSLPLFASIPIAIAVGLFIGYILPSFNTHAMRFHQGYNLYASGFSMGIISMIFAAILVAFEIPITTSDAVSTDHHLFFLYALIIGSGLMVIIPFLFDRNLLKSYKNILKEHGKLVTDFFYVAGKPATVFNMGVMGLVCVIIVLSTGFVLSGPVVGSILTVIGFAAFGKHPLNGIPVIVGGLLAAYITPIDISDNVIMAIFFSTALAPITGSFGIIAGLIAGFMHVIITPFTLSFQGGFDLYNNGFAAGFVAGVLTPILVLFRKDEDDAVS